ncbi:response regulator [Sulfurospirillum oryzae]|uniref:response regulator n=1 Tax=Sulfurospirillum oryzae TaxID=2976535 RepID=UPI0021E75C0E|nr:response regulator [Sulfurospirillum oryzae]
MTKTKILIVEDEAIVALDIKKALIQLGHDVITMVTNHDDAIRSVEKNRPDIIIMDIYLNNSLDGIQTAEDIQKIHAIPILYLSAFADDETINRAVKTNPIGYLTKPFKREELKSTIQLGLYKKEITDQLAIDHSHTSLGLNYSYDHINGQLFYGDMLIKLGIKENALLRILIEAKGKPISFQELEYFLWPDTPISKGALRTLIYRTRAKLEYKFIETIPSVGCKLTPISSAMEPILKSIF